MSKVEILAELPNLPPEDRAEIQSRIEELANEGRSGWLDSDDPLTEQEKVLIDERLDDLEKHPENSISWSKAEAQLKTRFGE
jgi:hypothetical protein